MVPRFVIDSDFFFPWAVSHTLSFFHSSFTTAPGIPVSLPRPNGLCLRDHTLCCRCSFSALLRGEEKGESGVWVNFVYTAKMTQSFHICICFWTVCERHRLRTYETLCRTMSLSVRDMFYFKTCAQSTAAATSAVAWSKLLLDKSTNIAALGAY